MKKSIAAGVLILGLALTGCGGTSTNIEYRVPEVQEVKTPDGRTVTCVIERRAQGVALSCDWEGAK